MASAVQICNLALARIGVRASGFISSLDDPEENAQVCKALFGQQLETALALYPWSWAAGRVALALLTQPPWSSATTYTIGQKVTFDSSGQFVMSLQNGNLNHKPTGAADAWWGAQRAQARDGWSYMYALPPDYLVAKAIWSGQRTPQADQKIPFSIEASDDGSTEVLLTDQPNAELFYTRKITAPASFNPLFSDAFAWFLAVELSSSLRVDLSASQRDKLEKKAAQTLMTAAAVTMNEGSEYEPPSEIIASRGDGFWTFPSAAPFPPWWPY